MSFIGSAESAQSKASFVDNQPIDEADDWAQYPASQSVNFDGNDILNVNNLNATNITATSKSVIDLDVSGVFNANGTIIQNQEITALRSITFDNSTYGVNPRIDANGQGTGIIFIKDNTDGEGKLRVGNNSFETGLSMTTEDDGRTGIFKVRDNTTGQNVFEVDPTNVSLDPVRVTGRLDVSDRVTTEDCIVTGSCIVSGNQLATNKLQVAQTFNYNSGNQANITGGLRIGSNLTNPAINLERDVAGTSGTLQVVKSGFGPILTADGTSTPPLVRVDAEFIQKDILGANLVVSNGTNFTLGVPLAVSNITNLQRVDWGNSGTLRLQYVPVDNSSAVQYALSTQTSTGQSYLQRRETLTQNITGAGGSTTISFKALDAVATISDNTSNGEAITLQFQERQSGEPNTHFIIWLNNFSGGTTNVTVQYIDLAGSVITSTGGGASGVLYDHSGSPNYSSFAGTFNFTLSSTVSPVQNVVKLEVTVKNDSNNRYGIFVEKL